MSSANTVVNRTVLGTHDKLLCEEAVESLTLCTVICTTFSVALKGGHSEFMQQRTEEGESLCQPQTGRQNVSQKKNTCSYLKLFTI